MASPGMADQPPPATPPPLTGWDAPSFPAPAGPVGPQRRKPRTGLVAGLIGLVVLLGAGGAGAWWFSGKPDRDYLTALRSGGLGGQFASDAAAIARGKAVCAALTDGGKPQGSATDEVAVKNYCPQFATGFKVLETKIIKGSMTLIDTSFSRWSTSISTLGGGCQGDGGYSDITPGREVVVKNAEGKVLATTNLGSGSGNSLMCTMSFSVELTEGEESYVVTVSHRGDLHFTWAQLRTSGIQISLGS